MKWLALDIGGANLKAADGRGYADVRPFPLWRSPDQLSRQLRLQLEAAPSHDALAVTMTGELADCYETKSAGVVAILDAAADAADGLPIVVYATDGTFTDVQSAKLRPLLAAASNWHALAAYASRLVGRSAAVLIDAGSTTTDVIPLDASGPQAIGRTDPDRLVAGELVYTGVERTPLCAVASHFLWQGKRCPVASELFATAADAYLILGKLPEEPDNCDTADGRPRTRQAAHGRLARMVCADAEDFAWDDALRAAASVCAAQASLIAEALQAVLRRMSSNAGKMAETVILSGHGEFLGRAAIEAAMGASWTPEVRSLNAILGASVSRCAPAHALAALASERLGNANLS